MKIEIVVNRRIERLYEEYMTLIDSLKGKTKDERFELYESMTKRLYPHAEKVVDLEDQLNENRKDYQRKFKEWFFVICKSSFSNGRFGETCFELYKKEIVKKSKKDKCSSKIYAHKVILALGLMGLLEGVKDNYSHSRDGAHGYNYKVDMFKWVELMKGVSRGSVALPLDIEIDWAGYEDWFGERQFETIKSMTVEPKVYKQAKTYLEKFDDFFFTSTLKADEKKHFTDKWFAARAVCAIAEHDTYHMLRHSDDSEDNDEEKLIHNAGRYYTCLTNMHSEIRKELCIDGEQVVEVDISAAQPTMLGLLLRERYPNVKSAWLEHCEKGDFYEWIGRISIGRGITKDERQVIKTLVMRLLYTAIKPTEKQDETPFWWYLKTYLKEKDASKRVHLEDGGLFKSFDFIIMSYLKAEEPALYKLVYDARTNLKTVKRKKPTAAGRTTKKRNNLSIMMTEMEVKYIKACLKAIAPDVQHFYTIHDCVGCKASDAAKVKQAMLVVGKEMFGATLNVKLESSSGETIMDDFKFVPEEVVMKKKGWQQEKKAA
ncbi:MAG: hypothetical protein IJX65_09380 [Alistipes sp.]|nr:hypothetical protein [Alistipes sp.]